MRCGAVVVGAAGRNLWGRDACDAAGLEAKRVAKTPLIGSSLGIPLGQKHRCKMPKTPNRSQNQLCSRKETSRKAREMK